MFNIFWYDINIFWFYNYVVVIFNFYGQFFRQEVEEFIGVWVGVEEEGVVVFCNFDVLVVDGGYEMWGLGFGEGGEGFGNRD